MGTATLEAPAVRAPAIRRRRRDGGLQAWLFALPALAVYVIFLVYPALTSVWFPSSYLALVQETDWVIWTVALRNALLVGALLTLLLRLSGDVPSPSDADVRVDSPVASSSPG